MKNIIQLSGTTMLLFVLFSFGKKEIKNKNISSPFNYQDFKTIKIGSQIWMAENLDVDHYRNGDKILEAKDRKDWVKFREDGKGCWCYYDNKSRNGKIYGKLYNYYAVHDERGLAPAGWHVPDSQELILLINSFGSNDGKKLKSTDGWKDNGNGTNETGFNGQPGGHMEQDYYFHGLGLDGYWWSFDEDDIVAFSLKSYGWIGLGDLNYSSGASVRCIKDEK